MRDRLILPWLLCSVVFLSLGCAGLGADLELEIAPEDDLRTQVSMRFRGDRSGRSILTISDTWGGSNSDRDWFRDFQVESDTGDAGLQVVTPTRVVIQHEPAAILEFSYSLVGLPGSYTRVDDYRPIRNADGFAMIPRLGLFLPEHLGRSSDGAEQEIEVELEWNRLDDFGWQAFSSFGVGEGPLRKRLSQSRLRESFLVAGRLDAAVRADGEGRFATVQIGDGAAFTAGGFADAIAPILTETRRYFEEKERTFYLVGFAPAGESIDGRAMLGGTALTDAFAFYFDPGVDLTDRSGLFSAIAHVVCHEAVHHWNGVLFRFEEPDYPNQASWFTEGFTEFVARRLVVSAGVHGLGGYVDALNRRIAEYESHSDRDRPFREVMEREGGDATASSLAYQRGELVAFWIDDEVRRRSKGRTSLRNLFLLLAARGRSGERVLPVQVVWDWITQQTDPEFARDVREVLEEGGGIPLPLKPFGSALELEVDAMAPRYRIATVDAGR